MSVNTASAPSSGRSSLQLPIPRPTYGQYHGPDAGILAGKLLDPRTSSTQSLVPSVAGSTDSRRRLLIVYIHGFMGNDSSFRSFPAHVHNFLKEDLAETHFIHTKIYPRYKTYKSINVARDNFSKWLEPHESSTTDVVLVGHSMGGLLAADVALMPKQDPRSTYPFKHRILGTLSCDSPFLGIHPGVITAGISSLFRPAQTPPVTESGPSEAFYSQASLTTLSPTLSPDPSIYSEIAPPSGASSPPSVAAGQPDPFFNPPFFNDVQFLDRGWWKNVAHFAKKHRSENMVDAAANHILNHLEFGGCLADYASLTMRYNKLRKLDAVDAVHWADSGPQDGARVRFLNYYTICTGRIKKDKQQQPESSSAAGTGAYLLPDAVPAPPRSDGSSSRPSTPRISIEDHSDTSRPLLLENLELAEIEPVPMGTDDEAEEPYRTAPGTPAAEEDEPGTATTTTTRDSEATAPSPGFTPATTLDDGSGDDAAKGSVSTAAAPAPDDDNDGTDLLTLDLPPIPAEPVRPTPPSLDQFTDKDARRQAEKEGKRVLKAYEQAVRDRERAARERAKIVDKRRKQAAKAREKEEKDRGKEQARRDREDEKRRRREDIVRSQMGDAADAAAAAEDVGNAAGGDRLPPPPPPGVVIRAPTAPAGEKAGPAGSGASGGSASEKKKLQAPAGPPDADALALRAKPDAASSSSSAAAQKQPAKAAKKAKERKFCMLPLGLSSDANAAEAALWVPVRMAPGLDEVGAHCGLFFPGSHYESLVGDVGSRVADWVRDDASKRAVLGLEPGGM